MFNRQLILNQEITMHCYVLVTGLPLRTRKSKFLQAFPTFATSASDDTLLWDKSNILKQGRLIDRFFVSRLSIKFPAQSKWLNRTSFGKFSRRVIRLFERSQQSNASLVAAPFSIMGIPRPCKTSSRSPNGFVRCSARARSSAVILILYGCRLYAYCVGLFFTLLERGYRLFTRMCP